MEWGVTVYGYVYITENLLSGRKYIGQKQGNFDPTYLGSGVAIKCAVRKYGKENFTVTVMGYAKSRQELNDLERHYISTHDAAYDSSYYNIATGGDAWGSPHSTETRMKISQATQGRAAPNKGKPNPEARRRMREHNPMHNPDVSQKVAQKLRGRISHNRKPKIDLVCEECRDIFSVKNKERDRKYCGKSCAAKVRNRKQWNNPEYKDRVGRAISKARLAK